MKSIAPLCVCVSPSIYSTASQSYPLILSEKNKSEWYQSMTLEERNTIISKSDTGNSTQRHFVRLTNQRNAMITISISAIFRCIAKDNSLKNLLNVKRINCAREFYRDNKSVMNFILNQRMIRTYPFRNNFQNTIVETKGINKDIRPRRLRKYSRPYGRNKVLIKSWTLWR